MDTSEEVLILGRHILHAYKENGNHSDLRKSTGGDDADTKRTIDHQPRQGWLDEQGNRR